MTVTSIVGFIAPLHVLRLGTWLLLSCRGDN
jgi:hypothetical protein